jgi:hypothetical protein
MCKTKVVYFGGNKSFVYPAATLIGKGFQGIISETLYCKGFQHFVMVAGSSQDAAKSFKTLAGIDLQHFYTKRKRTKKIL